jgi:uncharacterized protein (DUF924 family)
MAPEGIDEILAFWFAPASVARWFAPEAAFDAEIARRFAPLIEAAVTGSLQPWAETPRGALALCLLLDQFPRNVWRGTPRTFSGDAAARRVAEAALAAGDDRALKPEERFFLYLPFEHSESLADQERCTALMVTLGNADWLEYARRHRAVIARFGRFPHRNAILGRPNTAEEMNFLREPGSSF